LEAVDKIFHTTNKPLRPDNFHERGACILNSHAANHSTPTDKVPMNAEDMTNHPTYQREASCISGECADV
jgi:hypothetical protein